VLRIFSPLKIRWLRPGLNPRTWVLKASTLTPRPPKPLINGVETCCIQSAVSRICSTLCNSVPTIPLLLTTDFPNSYPCFNILQYTDTGKFNKHLSPHKITLCYCMQLFTHQVLGYWSDLHCLISDIIVVFLIKLPVVHATYLFCDR